MATIRQKLERGERYWPAELVLRPMGLAAFWLCVLLARAELRLVHQMPLHEASPLEFVVAAGFYACLAAGIALTLEGPGLLRLVPLPRRPMLP